MKALALLLFGGLKLGKLATTGGTMLLSLVAYGAIWGWRFALGFLLLLLAYEMGHVIAARQRGLDVGAPTFIPFIGAWITLKDKPVDAETEAYVAVAGPFVGTLAAFAVYGLARAEDSALLLAIAYSGFFLNLFNLLPVSPLDGGRITAIVSPRIWLLGAPLMIALTLYRPSPALIVVAILALPHLVAAWHHDPTSPEAMAYHDVPASVKAEYAGLYLGLAALLALMTYNVHEMLAHTRAAHG